VSVALVPTILDEAKPGCAQASSTCPPSWHAVALSLLFYFVLFAGLSLVTLARELNFVLASLNEKCALHVLKKGNGENKMKESSSFKKIEYVTI
jgi:hypothetical protein